MPHTAAIQMSTDIALAYYMHFIADSDTNASRHENFQRYHQLKQTIRWDDTTPSPHTP